MVGLAGAIAVTLLLTLGWCPSSFRN
jgi:PAS domain-containing protein